MIDRVLADLVVLFHLLFIVFAIGGALLVLRWPKLMVLHLPAVAWAVLVEIMAWRCPLTPLEKYFRNRYGSGGYEGGFIDHYLIPIVYPRGLTTDMQFYIGCFVFLLNLALYSLIVYRLTHRTHKVEQGFEVIDADDMHPAGNS